MTKPVLTPRAVYPSLEALAARLGTTGNTLRRYTVDCGSHRALKPLDDRALQRWRRLHWRGRP